jgi:Putative transposase
MSVYAKRPFASPEAVLAYLGRYTHRVAIANSRLVAYAGDQVSFRWRDYRHHNKNKVMTLAADEFIRRFLLHALPDGFHRIRHYGFLANRGRADNLALCRKLLDEPALAPTRDRTEGRHAVDRCPCCGGRMEQVGIVLRTVSAAALNRIP